MMPSRRIFLAVVLLCLALAAPPAAAQTGEEKPERYVSIDFNNVDIAVFIKFISELTETNFVVDDRVKGKVTILSPAKISVEEAYRVFESVLEVHGFTTVKSGRVIKVVPSPDARSKSIETLLRQEAGTPEDRVVTQLIPLKYANADEIKRLFTPLVSKSSVIIAYAPTNILVVTDVYSNIQRLFHILTAIDVTGIGQELSVVPIEYADAQEMVKLLESVFSRAQKAKKADPADTVRFVADVRTNTLIVLASEDETARIKMLISMLDQKTPRGEDGIRVYYLEYAVAEDMAKVLQELTGRTTATTTEAGKKEAPVVSSRVMITADKATNSLIISAKKDDYPVIEDIIGRLDIPRAMVYIEAVIMEVNTDRDFAVGSDWIVGGATDSGDRNLVYGSGFRTGDVTIDGGNGLPISTDGFSLGVISQAITIGGVSFANLQALIRAFKSDKDINILSTPQILTTNNEEAAIVVGKNVPFQTRTSTSDNDTYNSFEYRDVGNTLKITPQISKDRMVRLTISLESSQLDSASTIVDQQPTTLKRTIDTTVIVKDASTVVIGGLIDDSATISERKVPILGDVPVLGWLFKTHSTVNTKTNLYVFLTPHVIKSPEEADTIYEQKKGQIESLQEGRIKMYPGEDNRPSEGGTYPPLL